MLPVTQSEPFEGLTDTIENGYFVFTLMPSLYCPYNCKHCYLSKEQRSDKTLMSLDDFRMVCRKIHTYFEEQQPPRRTIIAYNYGGEPTALNTFSPTQESWMRNCRHRPAMKSGM